jgi:hypothetical protein
MRNNLRTLMIGALSASALAFTVSNASAAIVCNDVGDCWHTHADYDYPAGASVMVHPDDWRWGDGDHFRWREHEGRGYWHGDDWDAF